MSTVEALISTPSAATPHFAPSDALRLSKKPITAASVPTTCMLGNTLVFVSAA